MPKSKQRKGFKERKLKNRKALEASRANKQKVMQNRMNAMIEQLRKDYENQQIEPNVTVNEFSSATPQKVLDVISNEELENAKQLAEVEDVNTDKTFFNPLPQNVLDSITDDIATKTI